MRAALFRRTAGIVLVLGASACGALAGLGDSRELRGAPDASIPDASDGDARDGADAADAPDARDASDARDAADPRDAADASDAHAVEPSVPDTAHPAVVALRHKNGDVFCTGTLITPRVVLTAAHCFAAFANGCAPLHGDHGEADASEVVFAFNGVLNADQDVVIGIDDIEAAPSSYPTRQSDCPAGSALGCASGPREGLRVGSDLALVRLAADAPATATPIPVLTSLADNAFDGGPIVHARLDQSPAFVNRAGAPDPRIVGWGKPSCGAFERRAAIAQLEVLGPKPGDWHWGCSEVFACDGAQRADVSCATTDLTGNTSTRGNTYQAYEVRVARTQSAAGVYDGPAPSYGDTGSPLLFDAVDLSGAPVTYIAGALSTSPQPESCVPTTAGYRTSRYASTFSPENGAWIEKVLAYWALADSIRIDPQWTAWETVGSTGGELGFAPAVDSQGPWSWFDVFVVGKADNRVYGMSSNGHDYWYPDYVPGPSVSSAPSACSWAPNRKDIVARSATGDVIHWWYVDGWFWETLPSSVKAGTAPAIATWGFDTAHIFAVSPQGTLSYLQYDHVNGWNPWVDLGALASDLVTSPSVVAWSPGRLDVFAQRSDGAIVHVFEDADAMQLGFQSEVLTSPSILKGSGVAAASWMPGRLDLVGRSADDPNALVWRSRTTQGWAPNAVRPLLTGGLSGSVPALVQNTVGRLDLFSQGPPGSTSVLHAWLPR